MRLNSSCVAIPCDCIFPPMSRLHFQVSIPGFTGFTADAVLGNTIFEVKARPRNVREMRASLLQLAGFVASSVGNRAVLILVEPLLSAERIQSEWTSAASVIRAEVLDHMALVIYGKDSGTTIGGRLTAAEQEHLPAIVNDSHPSTPRARGRTASSFLDILRVLLVHWVRGSGPLTTKQICEDAGFSYPTTSAALGRLRGRLKRYSDRRVELNDFPRDAWFKLVAQSEAVRSSRYYMDTSGKPRSPEKLLERLCALGRSDIAVGGALGARHYVPGLDIIGTPRIDLIVHKGHSNAANGFLRKLDPGLKPAEAGKPPTVVVHSLERPVSFFEQGENGMIWADEIECLLDLQDARLEPQAREFLERITTRAMS